MKGEDPHGQKLFRGGVQATGGREGAAWWPRAQGSIAEWKRNEQGGGATCGGW